MEVKLKKCSNCLKEIEETKLIFHEPTCIRNYRRCTKCEDVYPIEEEEEHMQEHIEVNCDLCGKKFNKNTYTNHRSLCKKLNFAKCKFCDLDILREEYAGHEEMCGSRTEICFICHKNIIKRNYESHVNSCQIETKVEDKKPAVEAKKSEVKHDNKQKAEVKSELKHNEVKVEKKLIETHNVKHEAPLIATKEQHKPTTHNVKDTKEANFNLEKDRKEKINPSSMTKVTKDTVISDVNKVHTNVAISSKPANNAVASAKDSKNISSNQMKYDLSNDSAKIAANKYIYNPVENKLDIQSKNTVEAKTSSNNNLIHGAKPSASEKPAIAKKDDKHILGNVSAAATSKPTTASGKNVVNKNPPVNQKSIPNNLQKPQDLHHDTKHTKPTTQNVSVSSGSSKNIEQLRQNNQSSKPHPVTTASHSTAATSVKATSNKTNTHTNNNEVKSNANTGTGSKNNNSVPSKNNSLNTKDSKATTKTTSNRSLGYDYYDSSPHYGNDDEYARKLQAEFDEKIAKELAEKDLKSLKTKTQNDKDIAKKLNEQERKNKEKNDEKLAREFYEKEQNIFKQKALGDEEMARRLQEELNNELSNNHDLNDSF